MTLHEGSVEWPDLERYSDTPMFNTKAVVQQTGITAPTLRAWERRYSLLSPERANNDYRLYSERDIVLLRWLKERTEEGISISQAIALFRHLKAAHEEQELHKKFLDYPPIPKTAATPPIFEVTKTLPSSSAVNGLPIDLVLNNESEFMARKHPAAQNMSVVQQRLIEAFRDLDESMATMLMSSILVIYSVEQVCTELITPTLWEIGRLWAVGELSVSIEHFASNFFRTLLNNLFHVTPFPRNGPLGLVCCGPGEPHELGALIVALFLRRSGIRVAYLGQSIEIEGLIHTIKELHPALVCVSLTMPSYLPSLSSLAQQIEQMPLPRPVFAYGGQVFHQYPHMIEQIPGHYMHGDLKANITFLCKAIRGQKQHS